MGIEVYVLSGKNYAHDEKNVVYRVSYAVHDEIVNRIPLVGEFVSLCDRPHTRVLPATFIPFIERFREARRELAEEGGNDEEIHISEPHKNLGTYHGKISQIIEGLSRAKGLSKPISIDGVC